MSPILQAAPVINDAGFTVVSHPSIAVLRKGYYQKVSWVVSGEAPKDFLRVYEYGTGRKANPGTWPAYIAKVGVKWYPNESITEHLLTRLGQIIGAPVTPSRLMWIQGQLRFLSRYFLREQESLIHGAEIFAEHLADREFVERVEEAEQSRNVFTFQVVEESIRSLFPNEAAGIMNDFVRLLAFDAIVGNNDRHYYNWGVITHMAGRCPPRLAPIYVTARALFWNESESKLVQIEERQDLTKYLNRYIQNCLPKTGWDGVDTPNHFQLMEKIAKERPQYLKLLQDIELHKVVHNLEDLLQGEFAGLFSPRRQHFMLLCIEARIRAFEESVKL
jgi:hypothetical protein